VAYAGFLFGGGRIDGLRGGLSPCPPEEGVMPPPRKIFDYLILKWCISMLI